ncbi:MAG: type II toxin-antitoxin system HicB family antitoxin [Solirubrobacterales bacterium]|nr:type II toxin-antitoxin system HicB family antitoxin [Solirubrobacterales bacterium]
MSAAREFDVVMVLEPEGGYSVLVPELPSVASQGETSSGRPTSAARSCSDSS